MKKYIRFDCDNVGDKIEFYLYNKEPEKAQQLNNAIRSTLDIASKWIKEKILDSEIVLIGADDILFSCSFISEDELTFLKKLFFEKAQITISIGIGNCIKESMQNLLIAKVSGKNTIYGFTN